MSHQLPTINDSALAYWSARGFTFHDIVETCRQIDQILVARFDLFIGQELEITVSTKVYDTQQGHFPSVVDFMKDIISFWRLPHLPLGSLIVWLEDGIWRTPHQDSAPILAFGKGKEDANALLIPDPAFTGSKGYQEDLQNLCEKKSQLNWEDKKPTIFWRGASSGVGAYGERWSEAPRIKLAYATKEIDDRTIFDAAITKIIPYDNNPSAEQILLDDLFAPHVPFWDFLHYRYLIDVDGEFCAWRSLFLKLASGSVVIKVDSNLQEWYYDRLLPWEHYIPIKSDLSNLKEIISWIDTHDTECREIARNAQEFIRTLTYENELQHTITMIEKLLSCYRGNS